MFENLRDAFREAIANFKTEVDRDDESPVPGTVDRLLLGMQNEVAQAKTALRTLHTQLEQARAQVLHESSEEATCRRREEMARRVGDEETARIAGEYAERHARRRQVLERKVAALDEEHAMHAAEVADMLAHLRETQEKRDTLAAADEGAETTRAANDLFDEIDRLAGDLDDDGGAADPWAEIERRPPVDFDERLSELKKRMGRTE